MPGPVLLAVFPGLQPKQGITEELRICMDKNRWDTTPPKITPGLPAFHSSLPPLFHIKPSNTNSKETSSVQTASAVWSTGLPPYPFFFSLAVEYYKSLDKMLN